VINVAFVDRGVEPAVVATPPISFHELTHEEPVDDKLGYQPKSTSSSRSSMKPSSP
jgi:hypothetical protein